MTTLAIIQARTASTRLPKKVLMDLGGYTVLGWVVRAARSIIGVDKVVVATSDHTDDDAIADWCKAYQVECFRGSLNDVLSRYALAAKQYDADIILRLTADCPLLDPAVSSAVLRLVGVGGADYASNCLPASWPDGLDTEVFTRKALDAAHAEAKHVYEREHVTVFLQRNRHRFKNKTLIAPLPGLQNERWTLDRPEDMAFLKQVVAHLPTDRAPSYLEVLSVLDKHPAYRNLNTNIVRNEGAMVENSMARHSHYSASAALLKRAEKTIPLGSQTFSKSRVQYPVGHAPLFLSHGEGGRVWDVDGNEYVDLVSGLLPVVLGYADPDVDNAIREQLCNGISFSLATEIEAEVAERIVKLVPCAEKVRFGKNGSDVTAAAVRLARAYTKRERIMVCGYHGWQDWYIGSTTRHKGVPQAVRDLTHVLPYNDLNAVEALLKKHPEQFAAMVMEPMNLTDPAPGYLENLKTLLHKHGALLVFDEVITGFRFAVGGAQQLLGVTPDIASFGKALANGMPLSAVTGRAEVMNEMENIFYSGTFGGETLSLVAARALLDKMQREPVIETLWKTGKSLREGMLQHVTKHGLEAIFSLAGKDPWVLHVVNPHPTARVEAIKTLLLHEMHANGVLTSGSHNVCYAHTVSDIAHVLNAYDLSLAKVAEELKTGKLEERLPCPPVESIFKVR